MNENISHTIPKRAVLINDLTGFGRCSLAVALPVVNAMKVQACPVPTSIFSNHMGFPSYYYKDLSDSLSPYLEGLSALGAAFDGIYCGFLNSAQQFEGVRHFLDVQEEKASPIILIDPVLGDHGKTYRIVTKEHCHEMKQLCAYATILTPNLTEACILTDTPFPAQTPDEAFLHDIAQKLLSLGPKKVAITGISHEDTLLNYCMEKKETLSSFSYAVPSDGKAWPGTGDLFASILMADALHDTPFESSVRKAADFIRLCVEDSQRLGAVSREGVLFENHLSVLWRDLA